MIAIQVPGFPTMLTYAIFFKRMSRTRRFARICFQRMRVTSNGLALMQRDAAASWFLLLIESDRVGR